MVQDKPIAISLRIHLTKNNRHAKNCRSQKRQKMNIGFNKSLIGSKKNYNLTKNNI